MSNSDWAVVIFFFHPSHLGWKECQASAADKRATRLRREERRAHRWRRKPVPTVFTARHRCSDRGSAKRVLTLQSRGGRDRRRARSGFSWGQADLPRSGPHRRSTAHLCLWCHAEHQRVKWGRRYSGGKEETWVYVVLGQARLANLGSKVE